MSTEVAPHKFVGKTKLRRFIFEHFGIKIGKCRECFEEPSNHPIKLWTTARPIGK